MRARVVAVDVLYRRNPGEVVDTAVAVARGRSRIGPPSDDPYVAAASSAARTCLPERLAHTQARIEGLTQHNDHMRELATTIRFRRGHRTDQARGVAESRHAPRDLSVAAATVPSIQGILARLDHELEGDLHNLASLPSAPDIPPE